MKINFILCTKGFEYEKDKFVKCHPHKSLTNLEQAIAISCNTYFCQAFSDTFKNSKQQKKHMIFGEIILKLWHR